jgi:hypothetical protein
VVTVIIVGVTIIFEWPTILAVIGFWMGVGINLINFRIIVIGSKNFLEKVEAGKRASMTPNIMLRFLLYGIVFIIAWRALGIPALLSSFVGACMVNFAFKSDGFFTMGLGKKGSTDLKSRASIDGVAEVDLDEADEIKIAGEMKTADEDKVPKSSRVLGLERSNLEEKTDNKQEGSDEDEIEVFL